MVGKRVRELIEFAQLQYIAKCRTIYKRLTNKKMSWKEAKARYGYVKEVAYGIR